MILLALCWLLCSACMHVEMFLSPSVRHVNATEIDTAVPCRCSNLHQCVCVALVSLKRLLCANQHKARLM